MIGWYIGLLGVFIGIAGGAYFAKSLVRMAGELRWSISNLVIASFIYVIFSSIMVTLGLLQSDIRSKVWELIPILFFLSSLFFVYGTKELVDLLSKIPEERKIKMYKK